MDKWEYQNKPCYLENRVVREPCKQRTACTTSSTRVLHSGLNFFNKLVAQTGFEPETLRQDSNLRPSDWIQTWDLSVTKPGCILCTTKSHELCEHFLKKHIQVGLESSGLVLKPDAGDAWHPRDFRTSCLALGVSNS